VRLDLLAQVREDGQRLTGAVRRLVEERSLRLEGLARGLPPLERLVEDYTQRLDDRAERLDGALRGYLQRRAADVRALGAALRSPREQIMGKQAALAQTVQALRAAKDYRLRDASQRLGQAADRLRPDGLQRGMARAAQDLAGLEQRQQAAMARQVADLGQRLEGFAARLSASSHEAALRRGYVVVRDSEGAVVDSRALAVKQEALRLDFHDGALDVRPVEAGSVPPTPPAPKRATPRKGEDSRQESLF
jgi:exodeoxyribonuclease VII large subunit